MFIFFHFVLDV